MNQVDPFRHPHAAITAQKVETLEQLTGYGLSIPKPLVKRQAPLERGFRRQPRPQSRVIWRPRGEQALQVEP